MNNSRKNASEAPYILPQPEQPFKGVIGKTYKDSTPHKLEIVKAPAGAPNVLYILIDDAGYGQWGTFGGQVSTPNLDRFVSSTRLPFGIVHARRSHARRRFGTPNTPNSRADREPKCPNHG